MTQDPQNTTPPTAKSTAGAAEKAPVPLTPEQQASRRRREKLWTWERYFIWPMFFLSFVYATLVMILMFQPALLVQPLRHYAVVATFVMWFIFAGDFLARMYVAPDRWHYLKTRWPDVVSLAVPFFRPLLPLWYAYRLPLNLGNTAKSWRIRYQVTVGTVTVFFIYSISVLVWWAEKGQPMASIQNWGDSLWWAMAAVTTVGYGDVVPVSPLGRILGTVLMFGGIFLVGVISASTVNALSDRLKDLTTAHVEAVEQSWDEAAGQPVSSKHVGRHAIGVPIQSDQVHSDQAVSQGAGVEDGSSAPSGTSTNPSGSGGTPGTGPSS